MTLSLWSGKLLQKRYLLVLLSGYGVVLYYYTTILSYTLQVERHDATDVNQPLTTFHDAGENDELEGDVDEWSDLSNLDQWSDSDVRV